MIINPYLFFNGRCDEAIEFYRRQLGAEVQMLMRYSEGPDQESCAQMPEGWQDKVMHSTLRIGQSTLFASDGNSAAPGKFVGIALSLTLADVPAAQRAFAGLSDGGHVTMPLGPTFFSPAFGMVSDRFGVAWMLMVEPPAGQGQ